VAVGFLHWEEVVDLGEFDHLDLIQAVVHLGHFLMALIEMTLDQDPDFRHLLEADLVVVVLIDLDFLLFVVKLVFHRGQLVLGHFGDFVGQNLVVDHLNCHLHLDCRPNRVHLKLAVHWVLGLVDLDLAAQFVGQKIDCRLV
jgi:hypothetical protein